jgi:hypothetical protein
MSLEVLATFQLERGLLTSVRILSDTADSKLIGMTFVAEGTGEEWQLVGIGFIPADAYVEGFRLFVFQSPQGILSLDEGTILTLV